MLTVLGSFLLYVLLKFALTRRSDRHPLLRSVCLSTAPKTNQVGQPAGIVPYKFSELRTISMYQDCTNGLMRLKSHSSFETTIVRLTQALEAHKLKLLAVIDHSAEACLFVLVMPPTRLFIFGSPLVGTPIMVSVPSVAIDFPMKALIQEDQQGVWISFNTPEYLQQRHALPDTVISSFAGIRVVCEEAAA